MRFNARQAFGGLLIAGVAGAFLFLPAISMVGSMLGSTQPPPASTHVPQLLGDALWARAEGGRATTLQPLNPFSIARFASCNVLAEWHEGEESAPEHEQHHAECMTLLPAVEAIGYVSNAHLQSQGVWQDPRVPFVALATMTNVSDRWTRAQLLDALAERGTFVRGIRGAEQAARTFFNHAAADLTVPEAALLAALLGNTRLDPFCDPERAAALRKRVLERMRNNLVIDDAAYEQAMRAPLGLAPPPADKKPCDAPAG